MKQNYRKSHDTFDLPSGARPRNATYALCTALSEICDPEKFVLLLSKVAIMILTLLPCHINRFTPCTRTRRTSYRQLHTLTRNFVN